MKEHKIFKPEMMFQDYIKSCWSQNIKTINDKIPISQFLKKRGVLALEINPQTEQQWYAWGLPVNKNWEPQIFEKDVILTFLVYTESQFKMDVFFESPAKIRTNPVTVSIKDSNEIDNWNRIEIPIPIKDIRMILFSGSSETNTHVVKDIVIRY